MRRLIDIPEICHVMAIGKYHDLIEMPWLAFITYRALT